MLYKKMKNKNNSYRIKGRAKSNKKIFLIDSKMISSSSYNAMKKIVRLYISKKSESIRIQTKKVIKK